MDADTESTMLISAVTAEPSSQTYAGGRRAKRPEPVKAPRPAVEVPTASPVTARPVVVDDTITFPAVGSLPEGRIPGARRA
ncbi:hypothetical protein, partial [Aeromicrobium sp.]|uniref:hypothetical protein n=1 Tax=Aeromicrobium sp. TaxID=1871063 RepID=UPI0028A97A86